MTAHITPDRARHLARILAAIGSVAGSAERAELTSGDYRIMTDAMETVADIIRTGGDAGPRPWFLARAYVAAAFLAREAAAQVEREAERLQTLADVAAASWGPAGPPGARTEREADQARGTIGGGGRQV